MKEDYEKLRGTVKRLKEDYNFRGPLHFTDFSNLNSIISIGYLCGRDLCYANNIDFFDGAEEEVIVKIPSKVKGCTRFYYVEKNNPKVMERLNIPVYLLFSEELLYFDLAIYTDGNADLPSSIYGTEIDFLSYDIDWDVVFSEREIPNFHGSVGDVFYNKKQAELLIDEPVPLSYLKNIIFRCNADYKRACNLFGKNSFFIIESKMFFNDKNYIIDYNVFYNKNNYDDVFVLHFSSYEPVKNNDNHEYRLYNMDDELISVKKVYFSESDNTDFHVEVQMPCIPVKFKFWFYGNLCIEETIG